MNTNLAHTLTDCFVSVEEEHVGVCWLKMPTA